MDLGLSCYSIGDGPLAHCIGARYAHAFADVTDGIPDHRALITDMVAHGCSPVIDLRTQTATLGQMIADERQPAYDPPETDREAYDARFEVQHAVWQASIGETKLRCKAVIRWYAQSIMEYLYRHPRVQNVEVWGSAEVAHFIHGRGELLDYSSILRDVYEVVKEHHPEVAIWTGGFGNNCDCSMLERGLAEYAPAHFDVCNLHPLILSGGFLDVDREAIRRRLEHARHILDTRCKGQPLCASAVGVPTINIHGAPARYGRFWRAEGGARVILAEDGMLWWRMMLDNLREADFQVACIIGRDVWPPTRISHRCGIVNADGTDKAFTEEFCSEARAT